MGKGRKARPPRAGHVSVTSAAPSAAPPAALPAAPSAAPSAATPGAASGTASAGAARRASSGASAGSSGGGHSAARGAVPRPKGTAGEVLAAFLKLGLTSFGGPIAHLGYFRDEFVTRRRWLDDTAYGDLVALCQFLPGPSSSQVGFALGMMRAGWLGALAAFAGFTLPSALAMLGFAVLAGSISGPLATGALAGLKIVAVAIVAQAVLGMARSLCPDRERAAIAVGAVLLLVSAPGPLAMAGAIALGGVAGLVMCRGGSVAGGGGMAVAVRRWQALVALGLFGALLLALPLMAGLSPWLGAIDSFYRAGALVFGGGHVVLPLLEVETVGSGQVAAGTFLAGYGAAQAVPGPLFTFAAFLGATLAPAGAPFGGALVALGAIFLPGFLILVGVLPFWDSFRMQPLAQALMRGANAAVVGVLGLALYSPVFVGAVGGGAEFALALVCFVALVSWRLPAWLVVCLAAGGGAGLALVGG
jgi:chromate transporter